MSVLVALKAGDGINAEIVTGNSHHLEQLHRAARVGDDTLLTFMSDAGIDVDLPTLGGETALYLAIKHGHEKTALLLIERGANFMTAGSESHQSPAFDLAIKKGHTSLVKQFIERGIRVDELSIQNPLYKAVRLQQNSVVKYMLQYYPNIDTHIKRKCVTLLQIAADTDNIDMIMDPSIPWCQRDRVHENRLLPGGRAI